MFDNLLREVTENPNDFNKAGKIQTLEDRFKDDPVALKVAYMMATSHEYIKPNVHAAISMAKNYKWEETTEKVDKLEGINKPVKNDKVFDIATTIKEKGNTFPLIVVNKLHGITPQSKGKFILFDGHHRKEALKFLGNEDTPVYKGKYIKEKHDPPDTPLNEVTWKNAQDDRSSLTRASAEENIEDIDETTWENPARVDGTTMTNSADEKIEESSGDKKIPLTSKEREAVNSKYGKVECSFAKNASNGKYYCYTHRTRSKYFDSPTSIPPGDVKFVSSTS